MSLKHSDIEYFINKASEDEIREHLHKCAGNFNPPLYTYVDIDQYGEKIFLNSVRFEAWDKDELIGLQAGYYNDFETRVVFLTHLDVLTRYQGKGIAFTLVTEAIKFATAHHFIRIDTKIHRNNIAVRKLLEKIQFTMGKENQKKITISRSLHNVLIISLDF